MKARFLFFCKLLVMFTGILTLHVGHSATTMSDWNLAFLNQILAGVQPGQKLVTVGDMEILVTNLAAFRDQLAGTPSPQSTFDGIAATWPSGNVYYNFSTSGTNTVPANLQKAFTDAATEWATFANLHFIVRTTQTNYITVQVNAGLEGGQSSVGMVGGQQFLSVSPDAWNRGTLCHEIGHALGLVHEHQRSDRDSYVTVLTNNVVPGQLGNFVLLSNSRNKTSYDFLSVMHYSRTEDSNAPGLDTLEPLAAYNKYLNIMGVPGPVTLSTNDRAGMALIYGSTTAIGPIVTNTLDSGLGSLRTALYYAYDHPGTHITFNIPFTDSGYSNGVFTIQPSDQLPWLVNATFLDGNSQPTNGVSNTNGPLIQLNGALVPIPGRPADGLFFGGTNCTVHRLVINGFDAYGIEISGTNSRNNVVSGCYLGISSGGTNAITNTICPLAIDNGAMSNTVGGLNLTNRNIISGSVFQGMTIRDSGTSHNIVEGNYIGLNAKGTAALPNAFSGIEIFTNAQSNLIGGASAAARNIISGNTLQGILISDSNTLGNIIEGNYLGLSPAGTTALPNGTEGVDIAGGASANLVGLVGGLPNVISGNLNQGILIQDNSSGNLIQNNLIGLNATGTAAISNNWSGIEVAGGPNSNIIGGTVSGSGNVISGNGIQGILVHYSGTIGNLIEGNYIGLNPAGSAAIPNGTAGIELGNGAQFNTIGGAILGAGNVISGNLIQGIFMDYSGTVSNLVQGNIIGLNATGTAGIANQASGIEVYAGPQFNTIGGTVPLAANLISGNVGDGIRIDFLGSDNNFVQGNFVGLNAAGTAAIPNTYAGIEIYGGPGHNLIGGNSGRNYVCGNTTYGVVIDYTCTNNLVQGNTIGLSPSGMVIPNGSGVTMFGGVVSNIVGGLNPGNANLIVSNNSSGVGLYDATTLNNTIVGNSMYGNVGAGISLVNNADHFTNTPVLTSATIATNTIIAGNYSAASAGTYRMDFYADPSTSNPVEGKEYLGGKTVTYSSAGSQSFSFTNGGIVPLGWKVIATATDSVGNTSQSSSAFTVSGTDSRGDGITDAWRSAHFGGTGTTTNSSSCATCDPDHDGYSNLQEYYAGTDPNNAASKLTSGTITNNGANVWLSFPTSQGVVYQVQYRDNLSSNNWLILADQILGTGAMIQITNSGVGMLGNRFYRVGVIP